MDFVMRPNITFDPEIRRQIDKGTEHPYSEWHLFLPSEISHISSPSYPPDCEGYALGRTNIMKRLPDMFPDIDAPQEGDIVLYLKTNGHEKDVEHVGVYHRDGTVVSKWGWGPVLKHPIGFVPTFYGDSVIFRRIPKEELQKLR